jgi:hypothetical protein
MIKILKRAVLTILLLMLAVLLFRGWLYRNLITYKSIGRRVSYIATNKPLIGFIEASTSRETNVEVKQIIRLALSITSRQLNFAGGKTDTDPNKLITSRSAHCVGYASFFTTTCNHLLGQNNLADTWSAHAHVGQLYFLQENIHRYFDTPFLKDHDFVTIENNVTGEIFAVDPTVNDYLFVDFVNYTK